ncbi:MAG: hypothetical protein MUC33_20185, partial [Desulfobacterales bacterium]|nr:hypothetical protein [Desulfobacterales bacterium]
RHGILVELREFADDHAFVVIVSNNFVFLFHQRWLPSRESHQSNKILFLSLTFAYVNSRGSRCTWSRHEEARRSGMAFQAAGSHAAKIIDLQRRQVLKI